MQSPENSHEHLYLPPRLLLRNWRILPSAIIYLCGLALILVSVLFKGYIGLPQGPFHFVRNIFTLELAIPGFLLCLIAPLVAPCIFRHRLLLLLGSLVLLVIWVAFCVALFVFLFGALVQRPEDFKYHFL